jgi:thiol-disulfide isomerase/thioredoxin
VSSIRALWRSIAAGACALTLLAAPAQAAPQAPPPLVAVGHVLPDVVMAGLNGPPKSLSSYRGRPLIINVWASWCSPCRKEAASLERLAWSKAGSRYTVIGISNDDDRNAALQWLRQSNATISHYIDTGPRWTLEHMLGASSIPVTVLVDAGGRVVARFQGARDWDSAESIRLIERAFAGAGRLAVGAGVGGCRRRAQSRREIGGRPSMQRCPFSIRT